MHLELDELDPCCTAADEINSLGDADAKQTHAYF